MIETKIAQCLQIQTHYADDVVKFHGQWCQMLQRDPEAQAPRSCHHPLQRVNHLSLSKEQFQRNGADDMLIENRLTADCSLCVAIFEIAQLSQALLT